MRSRSTGATNRVLEYFLGFVILVYYGKSFQKKTVPFSDVQWPITCAEQSQMKQSDA